ATLLLSRLCGLSDGTHGAPPLPVGEEVVCRPSVGSYHSQRPSVAGLRAMAFDADATIPGGSADLGQHASPAGNLPAEPRPAGVRADRRRMSCRASRSADLGRTSAGIGHHQATLGVAAGRLPLHLEHRSLERAPEAGMELSAQHGRIDRGRGIDIAGLGNAVRPRHLRLSCKILRGHAAAIGIHAPARVTPGAAGDGRYGVSGVEAPAGTCLFRRVLSCSRLGFGSYPVGDPEPGAVLRSAIAPCRSVVIEAEKGNLGSGTLGKTHIGGCSWPGDVALWCD